MGTGTARPASHFTTSEETEAWEGRELPEAAPGEGDLWSQASASRPGWGLHKGLEAPVLSSLPACLSLLGAQARPRPNKMRQETMNQGVKVFKQLG